MKKIINTILVLIILGTLLFEAHLLTQAQEGEAGGGDAPAAEVSNNCATQLREYFIPQQAEFGTFINEHFRSPKPTSELIPTAIEKFREFRTKARAQMLNYLPHGQTITAAQAEQPQCKKVLQENYEIMAKLLHEHIMANAYAKKTTRLLNKYKQINEKLEKLNFTIAQTYGYFAALSQKLPCYASKCVK
jgi:iron-sulfur cluster repair protein YtfE (RIC family)